jgi:hypothetical protein
MIIVDTATGLLLLVLGVAYRRRPPGVLLVAAGLAWFLGDFAAGAVYLHRGPLVHLVLAYPYLRPRTRLAWATIAAAYLCTAWPPLATSGRVTLAVAAALVGSALHGYFVASGPLRRARLAALSAAAVLALAMSAGTVLRLVAVDAGSAVQVSYDLLVAAVAAALCADLHWGRWGRDAVTGLVVDLGQSGPLRTRLARALGDPTLTVGFWLPAEHGYVDESGQSMHISPDMSVERPGGPVYTFLDVGGERIGVLVHDAAVLADPALVAEVAAATRLAMANIGLREQVRARAAEVSASRRRLVESADAARRALAEDLRQGPERRLDHVADLLGCAIGERVHGDLIARLERARTVLRDLVVGIHPSALTTGGLRAALPELVQLSPVPVELDVEPGRFPANIEAAGYFVCSEALTNIARTPGRHRPGSGSGRTADHCGLRSRTTVSGAPGLMAVRACVASPIGSRRSAERCPSRARRDQAPG